MERWTRRIRASGLVCGCVSCSSEASGRGGLGLGLDRVPYRDLVPVLYLGHDPDHDHDHVRGRGLCPYPYLCLGPGPFLSPGLFPGLYSVLVPAPVPALLSIPKTASRQWMLCGPVVARVCPSGQGQQRQGRRGFYPCEMPCRLFQRRVAAVDSTADAAGCHFHAGFQHLLLFQKKHRLPRFVTCSCFLSDARAGKTTMVEGVVIVKSTAVRIDAAVGCCNANWVSVVSVSADVRCRRVDEVAVADRGSCLVENALPVS